MADVRTVPVLFGVVLLALAAGCTSSADEGKPDARPAVTAGSPPPWTEPANYTYTVERKCDGKESLGVYRVTVAGGEVSNIERTDGRTATGEEEIELPTLGGLVDLAQTAADDGGKMTTSSDPADGHPVAIAFDVSDAGDNEDNTCFVISDYKLQ
ncbi:DUF6174 domain-containing protein [Winogradskya humida]|uniref:Lipoprotein n=1 Tax=Winogradskya humida TaxID=113566 RepID=A0ABQ3ZF58_9ACTN|nr:DUF6174 domain-containing protein [Actinoplanes humidus]GIE17192.1 hypothetical protein Ahu01nite_002940 [Actinoplanes humidus]